MVVLCFEDQLVMTEVRAVTPRSKRQITMMVMKSLWKAGTVSIDIIYEAWCGARNSTVLILESNLHQLCLGCFFFLMQHQVEKEKWRAEDRQLLRLN